MANILVRTSIATLTALTVSVTAMVFSSTASAAAPLMPHNSILHNATWHYGYYNSHRYYKLPAYQVIRILYRQGFREIHNVYLSHGKYYARAKGTRGPVKLVVDARNGRILNKEHIGRPHRPDRYHYYRYGRPHSGFSWSFTFSR